MALITGPGNPQSIREARIAALGELEADDGFADWFDDWRERNAGLYIGPEITGALIAHAADMFVHLGRRLNSQELTWTYISLHGSEDVPVDRYHYNNIGAYCTHPEAERMLNEWIGRLATHRRKPIWVEKRLADGKPTPLIKTDMSLCPTINGHTLKLTGTNPDSDRAIMALDRSQQRLARLSTRTRNMAIDQHAKLAVVSNEVYTTEQDKVALTSRVAQIESQMADISKRLESGKK